MSVYSDAPSVLSPTTFYSTLEQRIECAPKPEASAPFPVRTEASGAAEQPAAQFMAPVSDAAAVDSIDLTKIGSILNSLSSVMKNTGVISQLFEFRLVLVLKLDGNALFFFFLRSLFASFRSRSGESSCDCPI